MVYTFQSANVVHIAVLIANCSLKFFNKSYSYLVLLKQFNLEEPLEAELEETWKECLPPSGIGSLEEAEPHWWHIPGSL